MSSKRVFSSGIRILLVLLSVVAVAGGVAWYMQSHRPARYSPSHKIAGAWGVERSGSGLAVNWNFDAPLFRDAGKVTLDIEDGSDRRHINLNRTERAGTLFYTPQEPDVTLRLHIQPAAPGQAEKIEVIRFGPQLATTAPPAPAPVVRAQPEAPRKTADPPEESSRSRTESPVSVWRVRAAAPASLTKRLKRDELEVPVYVKISPSGKVTSASTRKYDDPTEAALANIAAQAAKQWKFRVLKGRDRDRNAIYRDYVIHFKFPRT